MAIFTQRKFITLAASFAAILLPAIAEAASPFVGGARGAKEDFLLIAQILVSVIFVILGLLGLTGRIAKGWALCGFLAVILVFGHEQIVSIIRSWAGV